MKNWLPLVFWPLLAMAKTPALSNLRSPLGSSSNW